MYEKIKYTENDYDISNSFIPLWQYKVEPRTIKIIND